MKTKELRKKELEASDELSESRQNLENLEIFHEFNVLFKEGIINEAEFKVAKHHIIFIGGSCLFRKSSYERFYLGAIPVLQELMTSGRLSESQYHEAIPLLLNEERNLRFARYLRCGFINFSDFIHPEKSRLLRWFESRGSYVQMGSVVINLYEKYGYRVSQYLISAFRRKLRLTLEKGDEQIVVCQSPCFFGGYKIYIVDCNRKRYTYEKFIEKFK